jgi:hypothetical protein
LRLALSRHLRKWTYAQVGREISRITRYADRVVHLDPLPSDTGMLLDAIDAPLKQTGASANFAGIASGADADAVDVILFNGNFNHSTDIQGLIESVRPHLGRRGRTVVLSKARSNFASVATTFAFTSCTEPRRWTSLHLSTTCWFVSKCPSLLTKKPVPVMTGIMTVLVR